MRDRIIKGAKVLTGIIIAFAAVLTAILLLTSDSEMAKNLTRALDEIGLTLDIFAIGTYIIAGLTLLLVVGFSIMNLFVKPKAAVNALVGVGVLVVIIVISYIFSTSYIDPKFVRDIADNITVTNAMSKQVGAGLIATYILGALSILAIIYTWITKLIKG
jgi:hypothetical protein